MSSAEQIARHNKHLGFPDDGLDRREYDFVLGVIEVSSRVGQNEAHVRLRTPLCEWPFVGTFVVVEGQVCRVRKTSLLAGRTEVLVIHFEGKFVPTYDQPVFCRRVDLESHPPHRKYDVTYVTPPRHGKAEALRRMKATAGDAPDAQRYSMPLKAFEFPCPVVSGELVTGRPGVCAICPAKTPMVEHVGPLFGIRSTSADMSGWAKLVFPLSDDDNTEQTLLCQKCGRKVAEYIAHLKTPWIGDEDLF